MTTKQQLVNDYEAEHSPVDLETHAALRSFAGWIVENYSVNEEPTLSKEYDEFLESMGVNKCPELENRAILIPNS